jgi:hypothetical protein
MTRKRKTKARQTPLEELAQKVTTKKAGSQFVFNPPGEASMSDAISQLIEPYKVDAPDFPAFRNLVTFACIAWNASELPADKQSEMICTVLAAKPSSDNDRLDMLGLITELMTRKKILFPNNSSMIIDFKVTDQGRDFHIAVASTLEKKK